MTPVCIKESKFWLLKHTTKLKFEYIRLTWKNFDKSNLITMIYDESWKFSNDSFIS